MSEETPEQQPATTLSYPVRLEIRDVQGRRFKESRHYVNGQQVSRALYVKLVQDLCYRVAREHSLMVTIEEQRSSLPEEAQGNAAQIRVQTPDLQVTIFPGETQTPEGWIKRTHARYEPYERGPSFDQDRSEG